MTYHSLGRYLGDPKPSAEIQAVMAVRDIMSATLSLSNIPTEHLKGELNDIELAHERLSEIIERITRGTDSL